VPNIEHSNKKPTASKRHTWTPEELELLVDLHSQGLYDREIAEALGVSRSSISNKRRKFGLVSNYVMETGDWGELREN
jgi:DNA-binding NarL/FixJ family response regulator